MSISRKNWSALSSLARQWTMEDEEEVERERRRRVKSSTGTADPEVEADPPAVDGPPRGSSSDREQTAEASLVSEDQMQVDFVAMLRVRDEKRRMRHVEALRRQKNEEEEEEEPELSRRGGGGEREERREGRGERGGGEREERERGGGGERGEREERRGGGEREERERGGGVSTLREEDVFTRQPALKTTSFRTTLRTISTSSQENQASSSRDPEAKPPSRQARKFVSSVSISLDKSPPLSVSSPPMSPCSPTAPESPRELRAPPCRSRSGGGSPGPVQNGEQEVQTSVNGCSDQTERPAFTRHTSRTVSFKMVKKKEEDSSPMQRSSSMRIASKKFEVATDQTEDKDKTLPFQRNSKQRASSRSIQEKMERLAQAAQKSEVPRSVDVSQRTLVLLEEVRRKRGLFEKEPQTESATSRQELRGFSSGVSGRIDRWLNKAKDSTSSHSTADLRHVNISSKRSLFENRGENSSGKL